MSYESARRASRGVGAAERAGRLGWRATRWRRTGTVRTSVGSRKLAGGGVRVAVANPRAKVDVAVCLADTGAVLSEATFSVFELDASIEHDRVCAALDAVRHPAHTPVFIVRRRP
jgi:hypothetical protein